MAYCPNCATPLAADAAECQVRLFVVFIAGIGVALMAFVAMFAVFSGGGVGGVYAACALLFGGLLWAAHPVYEFATRHRRAQAKEQ